MTALTIATWNVNSLRVRLPQVLDWLGRHPVDVLALQETKLTDDQFPVEALREAGYEAVYHGQKTYNGVALLTPAPAQAPLIGMPGLEDEQSRFIAATVGGVRVVCVYVPNGQAVDSDKYRYKLDWLASLRRYLEDELTRYPRLALVGDFNIAPADADVHDPSAWTGKVLCSEPERAALQDILGTGLKDSFRLFEQPEAQFSWWDYRAGAFRRNAGLRIDHILSSCALSTTCESCHVDVEPRRWERPSDHAPVVARFQTE